MFRKLLRKFIFGGANNFCDYETTVLEVLSSTLPETDQHALKKQIGSEKIIQRTNTSRMVIVSFDGLLDDAKLNDRSEGKCVCTVLVEGEKHGALCAVFIHKGLLSSLEFAASPEKIGAVKKVRIQSKTARPSIADEMDAQEH